MYLVFTRMPGEIDDVPPVDLVFTHMPAEVTPVFVVVLM